MSGREQLTRFGVVAAAVGTFLVAVHLGNFFTPTGAEYPWNPLSLALGFIGAGGAPWPDASTTVAVVLGVILIGLLVGSMILFGGSGDPATGVLRSNRRAKPLLLPARKKELKKLHPGVEIPAGQRLVRTLAGSSKWIYQGWRELCVCIFAPGRGKTSTQVVRKMAQAPGAAGMTTNKIDGISEVIAARSETEIFCFDPQNLTGAIGAPYAFRFNPLSQVHSLQDARELAGIFEASTSGDDDGKRGGDPQFDTTGRDLLAAFFLAAALSKRPLVAVYGWLTHQDGREAISILHEHGASATADSVQGVLNWPDRTRGSVFATAQRMASALQDERLTAWTVDTDPGVRVFNPHAFVESTDTLILASKEGVGSGGALVAALVRAVCQAGELRAGPRGRLAVPLVMELDECANIVRWPELPRLYSHYGSRGIILTTYFQSWAQGVSVFGPNGMKTLWDAAGIRIYGGGSGDETWLRELSHLIGDYDAKTHSTSYGRGGSTRNTQTQRRPRLSVEALSSLPQWQAVVFSGLSKPALVRMVPWWKERDLAKRIKANL